MKMSTGSRRTRVAAPLRYSVADLRSDLAAALRRAEGGEAVEVTRRGRPVAVLLGLPQYERLRSARPDFWTSYQGFRDSEDLEALGLDPDDLFADARERSAGRDVDL